MPSQLNIKEGAQLKHQRNCQVLIQGPHQFPFQIESRRYPRGFQRDMTSILSVTTEFGESSGYPSESTSDNQTTYHSTVPIIKPASETSETPTKDPFHAKY